MADAVLDRARLHDHAHDRRRHGAAGFRRRRCTAASRPRPRALDLTVLAADGNASAAGLFTTNLAQAAPVLVSKRHLERSRASRARSSSTAAAPTPAPAPRAWPTPNAWPPRSPPRWAAVPEQVLVASTGVIGVKLQMDKVVTGHQRGRARAGARQGQRHRPRHHDDRPVSEGVRGHGADRRGLVHRSAARPRAPA